ncbi:DUF4360 domain-containing protein [Oligoflexus tunisiensis]|uniref:DUF4360 domain-containing protein n=1 Tax=Oligoflexus tunisiensis TaxID=708132 RepID=UPI00114CBDBE|nr:DUF4360 domain-containing protein [Oligoflexus tunisiensis]
MKHVFMAASLIPACFVLACGTKKQEKNVPVVVADQSSDSTNPTGLDSPKNCTSDDVSQSQDCLAIPFGEMRVLRTMSWLNPEYSTDGDLEAHEGDCLEKFTVASMDDKARTTLDVKLSNMDLKDNAASCRLQMRVAFARGYAFAIRRVEVPLKSEIPVDSRAFFAGSYGIQGKKPLVMQKTLESRYSAKPLRLDYSVANQDIVWSNCSGQATVVVDTKLSMDFNGSESNGDLRIEGNSPYRLEIIWAKCQ